MSAPSASPVQPASHRRSFDDDNTADADWTDRITDLPTTVVIGTLAMLVLCLLGIASCTLRRGTRQKVGRHIKSVLRSSISSVSTNASGRIRRFSQPRAGEQDAISATTANPIPGLVADNNQTSHNARASI